VVQEKVEPTLIDHGHNKGSRPPGWRRPFLETESANRQPIVKTVKQTVEFPEQDETVGELILAFMGPSPTNFLERKVGKYRNKTLLSTPS
jgi:hypothetical protein